MNKQRKKEKKGRDRWRVSIGMLNWDGYWDRVGQQGIPFHMKIGTSVSYKFKTLALSLGSLKEELMHGPYSSVLFF